MRQRKKGNQWYFGMKAHIGVDAESGLAHTLATTPATAADVAAAYALLQGDEAEVLGDAGYEGVGKWDENRDADVDWRVEMRPRKRRRLGKSGSTEATEKQGVGVGGRWSIPYVADAGDVRPQTAGRRAEGHGPAVWGFYGRFRQTERLRFFLESPVNRRHRQTRPDGEPHLIRRSSE